MNTPPTEQEQEIYDALTRSIRPTLRRLLEQAGMRSGREAGVRAPLRNDANIPTGPRPIDIAQLAAAIYLTEGTCDQ